MKTTQAEALARIEGEIINNNLVYHDDSVSKFFVGPASDLDDLRECMDSSDPDIARDAYSHWCAGTSHGDGFATYEEALEAARA